MSQEEINWGNMLDDPPPNGDKRDRDDEKPITKWLRTPRFFTGSEPVNDFEINMLRAYVPHKWQLIRKLANRQLSDNDVDFLLNNFGLRIPIQVEPHPDVWKDIPDERKWSPGPLKPASEVTHEEIQGVVSGQIKIIGYDEPSDFCVPEGYDPPIPEGTTRYSVYRRFRFYVLDRDSAERASRMFDGFFGVPHHEVRDKYVDLMGQELWDKVEGYANATVGMDLQQRLAIIDNHLSQQERQTLFDLYWKAYGEVWKKYMEFPEVVKTFREGYLPQHPDNDFSERGEFYRPTVYTHRFNYWLESDKRLQAKALLSQPQDVFESTDAYQSVVNMMAAVVKPLPVDKDGNLMRGMEEIWYNGGYSDHDIRKLVDAIKQKQMLERAIDNLLLNEGTVKSAPDKWLPGSWESILVRNMYLEGIPPELNMGDLAKLPEDDVIEPGPFLAAEYLKGVHRFGESVKKLMEFFDFLRGLKLSSDGNFRNNNGDILSFDDFISKWVAGKSLVQKQPDEVVWTWWEDRKWFWEPGPNRKAHAVARGPKLLYMDFPLVMGDMNMVSDRVAQYLNDKADESGLSVRLTYDGPDSNYFRHHDVLWEAYQEKIGPWLYHRLKEVWNREVTKGTIHIRPIYYNEIVSVIPEEFIRNISKPKGEVPENDNVARLIQWFNRKSDRRARLWAGFSSHGRSGGVMGFLIPEAVRFVKEDYGTDNGLSWKDQDARSEDLVYFGWQNQHFNTAIYMARGLSIDLSKSVSPFDRLEAIASAIRGGSIHHTIAHHVADAFKSLDLRLLPLSEPDEAEFVKKIFAKKEIEQLGRKIVEDILEKGKFRREMREMKVA